MREPWHRTSLAKALVIRLMGDITELQRMTEDQRAEIARLKGQGSRMNVGPAAD